MSDVPTLLGPGDPDHLDPQSPYYLRSAQLWRLLRRQLFSYPAVECVPTPDLSLVPLPDVAAEVPSIRNNGMSPDGCSYLLRLREGVAWDTTNAIPVIAADFVRALERIADPAFSGSARDYFVQTIRGMQEYCGAFDAMLEHGPADARTLASFRHSHRISGLEVINPYTLRLSLNRPANDITNLLAMGLTAALPPRERSHWLSNGPYRLRSGTPRGVLRLEPSPTWDSTTDPIRTRDFRSLLVALPHETKGTARELDDRRTRRAWSLAVDTWTVEPTETTRHPGTTLNPYLVFNLRRPDPESATRSVHVRRAIALAIDKVRIAEIFNALDGVYTTPLGSVIPPGNVGYRGFDPLPTPGHRGDARAAREELVRSGHETPLVLIAIVRDIPLHKKIMQSIADDLSKVSIELEQRVVDPRRYYGSILCDPDQGRLGTWDIAEVGWAPDWWGNNGRAVTRPLFRSDDRPGTTNFGGYHNPYVDRLMEDALQHMDPDRAGDLWHRVDQLIMEDMPIVPVLAFSCRCCVARSGAAGWGTWRSDAHEWSDCLEP